MTGFLFFIIFFLIALKIRDFNHESAQEKKYLSLLKKYEEILPTPIKSLPSIPRMTTTQRNAIISPLAGMMVYDTTLEEIIELNNRQKDD